MFEVFTYIVAIILLVLPIFDWTASIILHRASKNTGNTAISERAKMAMVLAVATTLNGILATIRVLEINPGQLLPVLILTVSLILVSVPNLYWLSLYYRNKFRK